MQRISTCLWFDDQALDAAKFYTSVIPNSRITEIMHYPADGPKPEGSVLVVTFVLDGTEYLALNGGPVFPLSPVVSICVNCETQAEIDHLWEKLSEGGEKSQCGWVTDKFGLSWQIVPRAMVALFDSPDRAASKRAYLAMLKMAKLDIAAIKRAYDGV